MSHFTRVKDTKVTNVEAFVKACAELGLTEVKRTKAIVRPWEAGDPSIEVDIFCGYPKGSGFDACGTPRDRYGIGLQRNDDGSYDMVADWSLTGYCLKEELQKKIDHRDQFPGKDEPGDARVACEELRGMAKALTTKHTIKQAYSSQGFMVSEVTQKDGSIKLTLTR
jgi:hypothetical protein